MSSPSPAPTFAHLHLHSEYSLLDGGNRIDELIARVKELGMSAVAVTDHGNLYGAIEFYTHAKAAGIKPILGIEAYVAPGHRSDRTHTGIADGGFHLVLLAENETGWRNLLKLSSDSFLNGFYYKPRMDKETLGQWCEGLIAINGHIGSSIAHHLINFAKTKREEHWHLAVEEARWHARTFGLNECGEPRFFLELQRYRMEGVEENYQELIEPLILRLAKELGLPIVCDNDAHFLTAEHHDVHDTLCCISMQKTKSDDDRLRYPRDLYVKSPQEMAALFADIPEALANAARIAERCNVELDFSASHLPVVKIVRESQELAAGSGGGSSGSGRVSQLSPLAEPVANDAIGSTEWYNAFCARYRLEPYDSSRDRESQAELKRECDSALRALAEAGAIWRYGVSGMTEEIRARLDRELTILADKSISAYFLIVWDFVNWARQRGIPAAARGSGVGTMVGYVLGLSNACPVRYGLLFERFTDPDRGEYPDIDIDICQDGRAQVLAYVREKYGHVAQIITFGRLKAKAALKDVARVMGLPPVEGQRLSNLVPFELNITLDEAIEKEPALKDEYRQKETTRAVVDHARSLENHARHAGVHAAGVVIATQPLDNIVPLCRTSGSDEVVTQWDGPTCEKVGLLKMDFLGLRTLSTIERAKLIIRETLSEEAIWKAVPPSQGSESQRGIGTASKRQSSHPLDLDRLPLDDQRVFDLFRRGDTAGIFQFESSGMRQTLIEMKPDRLEDLIAANALFRPGPMDLIANYNNRKHGREEAPRIHEIVDRFTSETHGIMVYQEQVMQIVHSLGDIPLRAAYSLIKAISKKKQKEIDAVRPKFIEGAVQKGLSQRQAGELFDLILKFAGYGFNKSHSTGYAIIAYQTAYLKTYFPNQYMAALLTFESQARKVEDWAPYLADCRRTLFPDHAPERPHVGVEVLPPDINLSAADFTVVFNEVEPRDHVHGHVRFGLRAIKGAGDSAIRAIMSERSRHGLFTSLFDFCERVDLRSVNKATIESLIKCGAFDSLHGRASRASMAASIEDAIRAGQSRAEDRRRGQSSFFDALAPTREGSGSNGHAESLRTTPPWSEMEALRFEKEVLGFHASGHLLQGHEESLAWLRTHEIAKLETARDDEVVIVGGIVARLRPTVAKTGRNAGARMAWVTVQDQTGEIECVAFSDVFARSQQTLAPDFAVIIIGRLDRRRGEPGIVIDRVLPLDQACRELAAAVEITLDLRALRDTEADSTIASIREILGRASTAGGGVAVYIRLRLSGRRVVMLRAMSRIAAEPGVFAELRGSAGCTSVRLQRQPASSYIPPRTGAAGAAHGNGRNGSLSSSRPIQRNGHQSAPEVCASIDRY